MCQDWQVKFFSIFFSILIIAKLTCCNSSWVGGSCCGSGILPWMNFLYLCTVNMTASLRPVPCANFAAKKTCFSFLILWKFVNWLTHQTVVVVIYLVSPNFHRYKHLVFPGLFHFEPRDRCFFCCLGSFCLGCIAVILMDQPLPVCCAHKT